MANSNDDFDTLEGQAEALKDAGLFADALRVYERALRAPGGSENQRLWVRFSTGVVLLHLGRHTEALSCLGELYLETGSKPETQELAFRSFSMQLLTLRMLQPSEGIETTDNLNKRLAMVDAGLQWLRDIGRETWRPALLYHRSETLLSLNDKEGALDAAEEAYRIAKELKSPGFTLGSYAKQVALVALQLGRYPRALEVLDEMNGRATDPLEQLGLLTARVRIIKQMGPSKKSEALNTAREVVRLADQIQSDWEKLVAYIELAESAVLANSLAEARDALAVVRALALADQTGNRGRMLREARDWFRYLKEQFPDSLPAWEQEMEQALTAMRLPLA